MSNNAFFNVHVFVLHVYTSTRPSHFPSDGDSKNCLIITVMFWLNKSEELINYTWLEVYMYCSIHTRVPSCSKLGQALLMQSPGRRGEQCGLSNTFFLGRDRWKMSKLPTKKYVLRKVCLTVCERASKAKQARPVIDRHKLHAIGTNDTFSAFSNHAFFRLGPL